MLVTPAWLRQHLDDKTVVVLDVFDSDARTAFASGHIPGALFTNFMSDGWRSKVDNIVRLLPPQADIEKMIGGFGIDNTTHVVVVPGGRDKANFNASARVFQTDD